MSPVEGEPVGAERDGEARPTERRAAAPAAEPFRRGDVYSQPVEAGVERRATHWTRLLQRLNELLTSAPERQEDDVEAELLASAPITRANTVAVVSPKGGVGKTTCTFLVGNLLASALNTRVVAVDANRDFGTLASLTPDRLRVRRSLADLLPRLDRIDSVSELQGYVSVLPTGLHVLAAPEEADVMAQMSPEAYGGLLEVLRQYYEVVLLDLGTGIVDPLAQFGIERSDQIVLVTTPEYVTAEKVIGALRYLNASTDGPEAASLQRKQLTVVLNRATAEGSGDKRVIESAFRRFGISRHVVIPDDHRLRVMLDSATYRLDSLNRPTRVPIRQLGLAVAEKLV